jgi:site-specific recombinase XerD
MCLTGIRISDFIRLKKENLQHGALRFIPHKTRTKKQVPLYIPLVSKASQLIADENSQLPLLFNTLPEQKYNDYLKEIMLLVGINKPITNHSARHTFATLFLEKTDDVATLQRILGHTDIKDTMLYVHISTKKICEQMDTFNRLMDL